MDNEEKVKKRGGCSEARRERFVSFVSLYITKFEKLLVINFSFVLFLLIKQGVHEYGISLNVHHDTS